MSDETRIMVGLAFISLPTIAFGGHFLLSILKRAAGTEGITETQRDYFRAGHAHAGVLKRRASDLGAGVGMEDLAFMAWDASQRANIVVPATLDAFINTIELLEVVDSEPQSFTEPAPSGDN